MATTRQVSKDTSSLTSANALAIQRMPTYVAAADGRGLAAEIPDDDRAGLGVAALARRLKVSNSVNSTVFQVSAIGQSARQARELADVAGRAMVRVVAGVEDATTPGKPLLRARVLSSSEEHSVEETEGSFWQDPLLCGAAGLLVGLALAVAISRAAPRLRDHEATAQLVGAPVLGTVPSRTKSLGRSAGQEPYTNAIDNIRSGLFFLPTGGECLVVSLTPSQRIDNLPSAVDDLATSLVATGARVLVVDADLAAHGDGSVPVTGLAQHLSGAAPLRGLVRRAAGGHHVIAAGPLEGSAADLLHSEALTTLLDGAATRYDYVLVVTSPTAELAGATAVAARCSATVLLVPERTPAKRVRSSVEALAAVGAHVRGTVLFR